ncbi:unnamed protein product [Acanthosepion pharaonis]|uniref:Reverse transcriptase/retrotransposon-derived protein RNase H-like domain-containing protein n=1 Tax=Acanthosepion pharaonis TaxID=158019 RepID=A0A812D391_ACAPH|nr:unnamed protein product [Sepia pharaonis]
MRRDFTWTFTVANVKVPILGADFLAHYALAVHMNPRTLSDTTTNLRVLGTPTRQGSTGISVATCHGREYLDLLTQFTDITLPPKRRFSQATPARSLPATLAYGLKLNLDKCVFGAPSVDFLGHRTDAEGIAPLPDKISSIRDFPTPTFMKQLRRFLGMLNFYRRFIPNCATILQPLMNLLQRRNKDISLEGDALHAFHTAKAALANYTRPL